MTMKPPGARDTKYIVTEGPIGVGKTSLTTLLAEELGARLIHEQAEDNPFLTDFYRDPDRYRFQTQIFFLLNRFRAAAGDGAARPVHADHDQRLPLCQGPDLCAT